MNEIVTHFHMCGGSGNGAAGFNDADPSIGTMKGRMVTVGGIDVSAQACRDFEMMTGVRQACLDLFTVGMYQAFHGRLPPPGWREVTAQDVRDAAHGHFPNIVFASYPCKGFSGLLSAQLSTTAKYQALNELTLRGMWLTMEAFSDDPPELVLFENVPRIATRGRHLLNQIIDLLRHYGYAVSETTHDCGELGDGLGQSRRRFLLVARHIAKVPPFLYEPPKRALRSVGEVLDHMPLPGDAAGGPMHRIPALQWKTWVRLAFVEAGSDWRSLSRLAVEDGALRDFLIVPDMRTGPLGVNRWADSAGTVAGKNLPTNGKFSVADPRHAGPAKHSNEFRIVHWDGAARAVTSAHGTGQAVADPRGGADPAQLHGKWHVTPWDEATRAVIAGNANGAAVVADPRAGAGFLGAGKYRVTAMDEASGTVIARSDTGQGAYAVADPRPGLQRGKGDHYLTGGHYGVVRFDDTAGAVSASACHDNGNWSVADPRTADAEAPAAEAVTMPAANEKLVCRIRSLDGTWHRPFTTLELAALQSFIDPEEWFAPGGPGHRGEHFVLDGDSDQRWREAIGNAVPRKSAKAIGTVMGQTILLARGGETFMLGSTPIWVRPVAVALSVAQEGGRA